MDCLAIENLRVRCVVGDLPEERERESELRVDVRMECPARAAALADDLACTVDYAAVALRISEALREAKCRLLERAAEIAAGVCLSHARVESVKVRVSKASPVPGVGAAAVEIERP